jgi:hypothetical protein
MVGSGSEHTRDGLLVADPLRHRDSLDGPESEQRRSPLVVRRRSQEERRRLDRSLLRPQAPSGGESNWLETVPGSGFYPMFRFYTPTAPLFDGTWSLPDIELT